MIAPSATLVFESAPVALSLKCAGRDDAIEKVIQLLAEKPRIHDQLPALVTAVLERENLHSTAMPGGIAFPHARTPLVEAPLLAIARLAEPVSFGGEDVWLLFAVASPSGSTTEHLQLLSWLARRCNTSGVLEAARKATSVSEFRSVFAS